MVFWFSKSCFHFHHLPLSFTRDNFKKNIFYKGRPDSTQWLSFPFYCLHFFFLAGLPFAAPVGWRSFFTNVNVSTPISGAGRNVCLRWREEYCGKIIPLIGRRLFARGVICLVLFVFFSVMKPKYAACCFSFSGEYKLTHVVG